MKFKHYHAILAVVLGGLLSGCHSDVDLNNVDTQAQFAMGLALPVGGIQVTVGDIFGDSSLFYVDTLENRGVLTWKNTYYDSKDYHNMDLSQYFSTIEKTFDVSSQLQQMLAAIFPYPLPSPISIPSMPMEIKDTLNFAIDLPLDGINKDKTINERLDKAFITQANFVSVIKSNNFPFQWDWIDKVEIELGPRFVCDDNTRCIYKKGDPYSFGDTIPINIDNFMLNMMKKSKEEIYAEHPANAYMYFAIDNVYDTCSFNIKFAYTIPAGASVTLASNASLTYCLGVRFLEFSALWGMLEPSKDMSDEDIIDLGDGWGDIEFLSKAALPFSKPRVDVNISTQVAGALKIDDAYLFTIPTDENKMESKDTVWAEFNGKKRANFSFRDLGGDYLSPYDDSGINDTAHFHLKFDNTPDNGDIERMFRKIPKKLGYRFAIGFDQVETPQIRIVPSTAVNVEAICTLPLILENGVFINYTDTMRDISISQFSIDSLFAQIGAGNTLQDAEVSLIVEVQNSIPLGVNAAIRFLDEKGGIIPDPLDSTKDFLLIPADTFHIAAPKYSFDAYGNKTGEQPGVTIITAKLTKEQLNIFPKVKKIHYNAVINDSELQEAYKSGLTGIEIKANQGIIFNIGLTTQIEAIINLGGGNATVINSNNQ